MKFLRYAQMSSFYKVSDVNGKFLQNALGATRMAQSTFPGMLFGGQDFVLLNNNLVVISTTNVLLTSAPTKNLSPQTVIMIILY